MSDKERKKEPKIGKEQLRAAREKLEEYRAGKSAADARILGNERWMNARLRGQDGEGQWTVRSAWLYNCIQNTLADMSRVLSSVPIPEMQSEDTPPILAAA